MDYAREIIMTGSTVEQAVQKALAALHASAEEVEVVVESEPRTRLFGLWKQQARVRVIRREKSRKSPISGQAPAVNGPSGIDKKSQDGTIALENGQIIVQHASGQGRQPVIRPGPHAKVWVNGELIKKAQVLLPGDKVRVEAVDDPPHSEIKVEIAPDKLSAILKIKRSSGHRYRLADQPPKVDLTVTAVPCESVHPPSLSVQRISDALAQAGVVYGIDWNRVQSVATSAQEQEDDFEKSIPIAFGTPPEPPVDGKVELLFPNQTGDNPSALSFLPTIKAGDPMLIKHPPQEGKPGMAVTGEMLPVRKAKDVKVKVGRGTVWDPTGLQVIATRGGRPRYLRGIAEVLPQFVLTGDAEASAGPIDFDGDIVITGTVYDGVKIRGGGKVIVGGSVYGAEITADEGIVVGKNVVFSRMVAGEGHTFMIQLVSALKELSRSLQRLVEMAETVRNHPNFRTADLQTQGDGLLIKLLLERKTPETTNALKNLLRLTQDEHHGVDDDFREFIRHIHDTLTGLGVSRIHHIREIEEFTQRLEEYTQAFEAEQGQPADVIVGSLQKCEIEGTGQIIIKGRSCYYTRLTAGRGVTMASGVFRGDQIICYEGDVTLDQVGTFLDKQVIIEVIRTGSFQANFVNRGVVVKVEGQIHRFNQPAEKVNIWLQNKELKVKADELTERSDQTHA